MSKAKESKAQRMAKVVASVDPTAVATPVTTEKTKTPRKINDAVAKYRATPAFGLEQKITIVIPAKEQPKARKAQERYALYENGMTVGAYIEKSKKAGNPASLAANDVRWDHSKGFISVK